MSKTTKIIAALGVVAGLGVAALPAFTFAETVTGDVDVVVEVQPAIAMTITGNNDDGSHYGTDTDYTSATPQPGDNPSTQHWYERSGTGAEQDPYVYTPTTDKEVDSQKTYYSKVGDYNPVDSFNPQSIAGGTLDGHNIPGWSITGTSSSYASLTPSGLVEGNDQNGFRSTVTVYTNYNGGYTLSVKDADATTSLTHVDGQGTAISTTAGALTAGTPGWNFDSTPDSNKSSYAPKTAQAMPASDGTAVIINQTNAKTSGGSATVVDYNVATAGDQATGVYTDTIVYTATAGA